MPKNDENFKRQLDGFLRAKGFDDIVLYDVPGDGGKTRTVEDPAEAEQFQFHYKNGPFDYGTVTITAFDSEVTVWFNQNVVSDSSRGVDTNWTEFLKDLKDWALRTGTMGFKVDKLDNLNAAMTRRKIQKKDENMLGEGYYGTKHTSYSNTRYGDRDSTPKNIKMIIKHNKPLEETDKRYRYIDKIFLETEEGERLLLNTKKPSIGRVFARHIAEGGEYNDERWKHINEIASDISKLSGFVRATKSKQFNEGVSNIVEQVMSHYNNLKETIKKLQGQRGYTNYFESWKPTLTETEDESENLAPLFKTEMLDPRIEAAMPVLSKLNIKHNEISEANEFEDWANNIIEGISSDTNHKIEQLTSIINGQDDIPVGDSGMNAKGILDEILDDDEFKEELYRDLEAAAENDVDHMAGDIIRSWLKRNSDQKYFQKVLDNSSEPQKPIQPPAKPAGQNKPEAQTTPQPQKQGPSPEDMKAAQKLMPPPMESSITRSKKPIINEIVNDKNKEGISELNRIKELLGFKK